MKREDRRRQLLEAALDVFSSKGYHGASVADVIRRAGVARGTFYLYFESKRNCFEALLDQLLDHLYRSFLPLDISKFLDEEEIRRKWSRTAADLMADRKVQRLSRLALSEAVGIDAGFSVKIERFYDRLAEMTARYLAEAQRQGRVRPIDPEVAARCIIGLVKENVWIIAKGGEKDPVKVVGDMLAFGLRGLLVP